MKFTNQCAGDLGIRATRRVDDIPVDGIVAIYFRHLANNGMYEYQVFDIVRGGYPTICEFEADALNAMLEIAKREERT